ncbi:MAG: Ig-like domain-containing protein [Eubacterium sp.]|nr:Ig-like domain-containing protein [Eubacterium sp.]
MKRYKRFLSWVVVFLMVLSSVNIPFNSSKAASAKKVKSVKLNYSEYTLKKGKKLKLKATTSPQKVKSKQITWKTSKKSVASVSRKGVVKACKKGTATITATVKGTKKKATCKITVGTPVKSVTVSSKNLSLVEGQSVTVKAQVSPKTASNKKLTWASSDDKIVKAAGGKITAVKKGKAVVTVQAKDGSKKKAKISVEVTEAKHPVSAVSVTLDKASIFVNERTKATAKLEPADAEVKTVTWSVKDSSIAGIDQNGNIVGKNPGKTDIIATSNNNVKGTKEIEVKPISVEKVELNQSEANIYVNETISLVATISPANATNQKVTWKSSDSEVATVSDSGKVTALKPGEAEITAETVDGKKTVKCVVKVANGVVVNSFAKLQSALDGNYEYIALNSDESGEYEISGEHLGQTLVVNAPKATVNNKGVFKKIEIKAISENTWHEKATGNLIDLKAASAHIVVKAGASAELEISEGSQNVRIENDGTINKIAINTNVDVAISGTNRTKIPVRSDVAGTKIKTNIPLSIEATKTFTLDVRQGAETSTVAISDNDAKPSIQGIGVIPVTNKATNDTEDIVAQNVDSTEDGENTKGSVTGFVVDEAGSAKSGAHIYMIPYIYSIEENAIQKAVEEAKAANRCFETTSSQNGSYTISDIPYGNYLMIVEAENLQTSLTTIVLNESTVTNETITLMEQSETPGSVEGTLYDAYDASRVPAGITLILRRNHNNTSGISVSTTTTDENGDYKFDNVPAGNYTIQVVDNRTEIPEDKAAYVRMSFNITVRAGQKTTEDMTISQGVSDSQVRFVLTWGTEKDTVSSDLDSHLVGPDANGTDKFHTYYSDMTYEANDVKYVALDVDDTTYEGPETTTIYNAVSGSYHFYVYDYTNQDNNENTILSTSEAVVKVYRGEQNVATYNVPNGTGTLWDVCTYDIETNTLTPINKITYHPGGSSEVGLLEPIDISKKRLKEVLDEYDGMDFGAALQEEVSEKIRQAKECYDSEQNFEIVFAMSESLRNYFPTLVNSTAIEDISSERIKGYEIIRRGGFDDVTEESISKEYSVITLSMKDTTTPLEDITVTPRNTTASYEIKPSDKEEFNQLIVVTDSATKASEKYYVRYKKYVPSLYLSNVTDGDNYIIDYDKSWYYNEETDEDIQCYRIVGENDTLASPVFVFKDEEITYVYEPSTEENKQFAGTLTITYDGEEMVFPVLYEKRIRTIYLNEVKDGDVYLKWGDDWYYDEDTDDEYLMYDVYGTNEKFSTDVEFTFNTDGATYELAEVEGKKWNYELTVTYKGQEQVLYIRYNVGEAPSAELAEE